MLIHRISRAPEKRIFYINVGAIPPNEVENFMKKTITTMKKTPFMDPQTGEYNLKYNMQNMLEDFYIPVRGNDQTTKIETTKGLEYNGIEDPFTWSREVVNKLQMNVSQYEGGLLVGNTMRTGLYYSPNYTRQPSSTSEGTNVSSYQISIDTLTHVVEPAMGGYFKYVMDFIMDMKKVFPTLGDDWGMYIPEVKYLSPEVKVNYKNLSLIDYPNVHFVGDALSARGITVSGAQAIYVAESMLGEYIKHVYLYDQGTGDLF